MGNCLVYLGEQTTEAGGALTPSDLLAKPLTEPGVTRMPHDTASAVTTQSPHLIPFDPWVHRVTPMLEHWGELDDRFTGILMQMDREIGRTIQDSLRRAATVDGFEASVGQKLLFWIYGAYPGVLTSVISEVLPLAPVEILEARRAELASYFHAVLDWIERQRVEEVIFLRSLPYKEYLTTEHWQKVRDEARKRSGYRCQICNSPENIQVHHRTYERRGEESDADVIVLCADCHQLFHANGKVARQ